MNPVFDESVNCLICKKDKWINLANVNHPKVTFNLQLCSVCGFVAQNPPLSEVFLKNYYENNYVMTNYNNSMSKIHQMYQPANARISYLRENNYISKLRRVLEIGPGAGTMMKLFSDQGIDITGIEPDSIAAHWIEDNLKLPVFEGFFDFVYKKEKVTWQKSLFDGIIFTHVLEHISNPSKFFSKLKKIMNEDGILIIEVPNIERPFSDEMKWETYCDPGHLHYFSKNTLETILRQSGFVVDLMTDEIFEPYGNLFCIAKIQNKKSNLGQQNTYNDNPINIENIWNTYIKYHKWRWFKYKISRIFKKLKFY